MNWLIYGAGGHGKVVWNIIRPDPQQCMVVDANPVEIQRKWPVAIKLPWEAKRHICGKHQFIVAIGNNAVRMRIADELRQDGHVPGLAIDTTTCGSTDVIYGDNTVICPGAHIGPGAVIGDDVIVNTMANVDHDCQIGRGVHIAPHACLCGNVIVGEGALIGAGAILLPGAVVEDWATIGAGAVVLENGKVQTRKTVVGIPAKRELPPCRDLYDEYYFSERRR